MSNKYVKSLLLTAVCSAGAMLLAADEAVQSSINTTVDAFSIDKQQYEAAANSFISKGNDLFIAGKYKDAAMNYAQAAHIFDSLKENSEHFAGKLNKTKELIAKAYYYLAQETALKAHEEANFGELENAIALCKEAIAIYPASEKEMQERIASYEKMRDAAARRNRLSESQVIPDSSDRAYRIAVLLKQAKLLYYTKQYELARKRYQEVLLIDKISPEAIQGMRACDLQLKNTGNDRRRLTHKRAIAEAAWKMADPIIKRTEFDVRKEMELAEKGTSKKIEEDDDTKKMREKLSNIIIPRVNFSGDAQQPGTPLLVALKFLRDRSKSHDPENVGVNIFLYWPETQANAGQEGQTPADNAAGDQLGLGLNRRNAAAEAAAVDDEGDFDDGGDEGDEAEQAEAGPDHSKYPLVNMDLVNKPLIEIIDALAQATQMKYKIEKHAVVLAPKDVPLDDMQIKVFMFDESMLDALGGQEDPEALKEALKLVPNANVEFPTGSKVMYDARFRSLIVLNTPENLNRINDALMEIRKQEAPPMVQIQVKFVEIEQSDLKELGFIQSLGRPNGDLGKTEGRLQFDKNDETLYNSGRNTFTYSRSTNGYNYNLTINAVNQLDSKDVLSSPKVLTNPNKKVSIKMTSERYFEWDYEEGEFETSNSDGVTTYSYTPPWPEFEKQELGITMEITPKVDTDKRLIMLDVHPWVKTLVGWTEYEYNVSSDGEGGGLGTTETMRRPIVAERTTDTNVAIYDNETVVIGGIIKDYTVTIDDKVPILGDIPLVGNLFKSKSSSIKKTNLLIFVTARMLKPDGSPYYQVDSRGRPSTAGIGDIY
ncbi:MAG: hypothetical protein E7052_03500 [Lentisphaerae bacterium]|nr:hypothetical protein [Lentisphaerota bacterium]